MKSDGKHYVVRLELARQLEYPNGDSGHGYEVIVPLARNWRLDIPLWEANPRACQVRRFRRGEPDVFGHLERVAQGRWHFSYDRNQPSERLGFRFENEQYSRGQYVSIQETDGNTYEFVISAVYPTENMTGEPLSRSV